MDKRNFSYIWAPLVTILFLAIARINHWLIDGIFESGSIITLFYMIAASYIFPGIFYLGKNFSDLEDNLKESRPEAVKESLIDAAPYFTSFLVLFSVIKMLQIANPMLIQLTDIKFVHIQKMKKVIIGLNYASIFAMITYTNRRELDERTKKYIRKKIPN